VASAAESVGLAVLGFASSGLPGPKGNRETFIHCSLRGQGRDDVEAAINEVDP
jgi:23S rRNA (cytidine1920-2'-O)/16S rRNA (cytidine1409-2'-O)-methyltransferase